MMKNNLLALAYYLFYLLICLTVIFLLVITSRSTGRLVQVWPVRIGLFLVLLAIEFWLGTKLDVKQDAKFDFLTGFAIACLGLIMVGISTWNTSESLMILPSEMESLYSWAGPNVFLIPCTLFCLFLNVPRFPWLMAVFSILPTVIFGMGLRWRRRHGVKVEVSCNSKTKAV